MPIQHLRELLCRILTVAALATLLDRLRRVHGGILALVQPFGEEAWRIRAGD